MKYQLELDTTATLLDNLNAVEDSLREHGIMTQKDTLIAITDNPLDPSSITIAEGITISALDNPNSAEVLSVMPHDGSSITLSDTTPTTVPNSVLDDFLDPNTDTQSAETLDDLSTND